MKKKPTILGLDPGTKEMGVAVLCGDQLADYRVKTFRACRTPRELLSAVRQVMIDLIDEVTPDVIAIETAYFAKTKRSALLSFLTDELRDIAEANGITLRQTRPAEVRRILLNDPRATKREVAQFVVGKFPELARHFHPGDFWRERYWSHVFDAVALGMVELTREQ